MEKIPKKIGIFPALSSKKWKQKIMFYFFFIQKAENNRLKKSQLAKIL